MAIQLRSLQIRESTIQLLAVLCALVFFKNAWLSDDAYITFRSVEQWAAGHGPRWNAFERVQGYTSPLWFIVLCFFRLFSSNLFFIAIGISFLFCTLAFMFFRKAIPARPLFAIFVAGLLASPSFFDYTTSGLENPLGYLLIAVYLWAASHLVEGHASKKNFIVILAAAGVAPLIRHDLAILIWPATFLFIVFFRNDFSQQSCAKTAPCRSNIDLQWLIKCSLLASIPLIAWTLFSVVYYGLPFPNTAYAKLNLGIDRVTLIRQGLRYLWVSVRDDPTAGIILVGGIFTGLRGNAVIRALTIGSIIHLAYIVYIGGDFMRGRFLSYDIAWLFMIFLWRFSNVGLPKQFRLLSVIALSAALTLPFCSPLTLPPAGIPIEKLFARLASNLGVEDERNGYIHEHGLMNTFLNPTSYKLEQCVFGLGCTDRSYMRNCPQATLDPKYTVIEGRIGTFGYNAGLYCKIIDYLALTDPLLAQLPSTSDRIFTAGHNRRSLPQGYFESVVRGENLIADANIHMLYEKIRLITQSDELFSRERWIAIWELNSGKLKKYCR